MRLGGFFRSRYRGSQTCRGVAFDGGHTERNADVHRKPAHLDGGCENRAQAFEMFDNRVGVVAGSVPAEMMPVAIDSEIGVGGAQPVDQLEYVAALVVGAKGLEYALVILDLGDDDVAIAYRIAQQPGF